MSELFKKYYLFAQPSATEGVARIFNFAGRMQVYNSHKSEAEADICELSHDWQVVGDDIIHAVDTFRAYEQQLTPKQ